MVFERNETPLNILAIGPHPDDIEIGCFGTLARCAKEGDNVNILVLSRGGKKEGERIEEAKEAAQLINANLIIENLEDGNIQANADTTDVIRKHIERTKANVVLSPPQNDAHQDHHNTAIAVLAAANDVKQVYFYETVKSFDFCPNLYVDITPYLEMKIKAILCHKSQIKSEKIITEGISSTAAYHGFKSKQYGRKIEAFRTVHVSA